MHGEANNVVRWSKYVDVSENSGPPKSSILIGFSIIFTIHFGVPLFLETPMSKSSVLMCFVRLLGYWNHPAAVKCCCFVALKGPWLWHVNGHALSAHLSKNPNRKTTKTHHFFGSEKGNLDYLPGVRRQTNKDHKRDLIDSVDLGTWRSVYTDLHIISGGFPFTTLHYTAVFGFVQPSIPWLDSLHGFSMDALNPARQIR